MSLAQARGIRHTRSQLVEQRKGYSTVEVLDWYDACIADCDAMIEKALAEEVAYRANLYSDWKPDPI